MRYEGDIYRPPSEAHSLIVQYTVGCARNDCTFCSMYKAKNFRIRKEDEVLEELRGVAKQYGNMVRKIFLADGDALIVPAERLIYLLKGIWEIFPNAERITSYGAPADVLDKTPEELKAIHATGLDMVYMGLESGDDEVLRRVCKGVTSQQIVDAGIKLRASGIKLSLTIISGLGGRERMKEHAIASAQAMSKIKPEYASLLTLMVEPGTPLYDQVKNGEFQLLDAVGVMDETKLFLENSDSEGTVFRANHASNYLALAGTFNRDRERLIKQVEEAKKNLSFRPEGYRRL